MAKNRMQDLRDHLFAVIESLQDDEKPMELDRARTVAEVAKQIIDSARVEVAAMDVVVKGGGRVDEAGQFFQPRQAIGGHNADRSVC